MTPELQKYHEDRQEMMASKAWKDLISDVQEMYESTNNVFSIQDEKTLHFKRGELSIMRWIMGLQEMSEKVYQQLKDEDAATS